MSNSILEFIDNNQNKQLTLLKELVVLPSYTLDKQGVDKVGTVLMEFLTNIGMSCQVVPQQSHGNHLVFRTPAALSTTAKSILLVGHMDTVFPPESDFNWFNDDGYHLYGPGVIDMKGGLVVAAFALKALAAQGLLDDIPIVFICNSDEETGSLTSRTLIEDEAKKSALALVFECGGLKGEVVTGRKGKRGYTLRIKGKASHAAFAGKNKASAILELAKKIVQIEALNNPATGLVVNVGKIEGGIGPNTVAENASALIDTRFLTIKDAEQNRADIEEIAKTCTTPETITELETTSARLPMEPSHMNMALYRMIEKEANKLGINIINELRSGVSDANTIATCNIPVVDGLGPIGDCDHSEKEYLVKPSLFEKTKLCAMTLLKLSDSLQKEGFL